MSTHEASWASYEYERPRAVMAPIAGLGRVVVALFAVAVAIDLAGVASSLARLDLIDRLGTAPDLVTEREIQRDDAFYGGVGVAQALVTLAVLVMFVLWLRQAYDNAAARRTYRLRYSRGWTAGAWFVPVLNLFSPKQIVDDVWRASRPDPRATPRVPRHVHLWWAAFLLSETFGALASRPGTETLDGLRSDAQAGLVSDLTGVLAGVLAIVLVVRLTAIQSGWLPDPPPAPPAD